MSNANVPFQGAFPGARKVHIMNGVDYNITKTEKASPIVADLSVVVPGKVAYLSAAEQFTLGLNGVNTPAWFIKSDIGEDAGGGSYSNYPVDGYQTTNQVKLALFQCAPGVKLLVPQLSYVAGTYAYGTELTAVTQANTGEADYVDRGKLRAAVATDVVIAVVGKWNGFDAGQPVAAGTIVTQPRTTIMSSAPGLVVEFVTPYVKA